MAMCAAALRVLARGHAKAGGSGPGWVVCAIRRWGRDAVFAMLMNRSVLGLRGESVCRLSALGAFPLGSVCRAL